MRVELVDADRAGQGPHQHVAINFLESVVRGAELINDIIFMAR